MTGTDAAPSGPTAGSPRPLRRWAQVASLPRLETMTTALRTMVINLGFLAVLILMVPSVAGQFSRSQVIIEPIVVPTAIARQGLKPDVVANRLWDGLSDFAATASVARQSIVTIPNSQVVQFSLPSAGFSIDSLFAQVRHVLGIFETRISGELTCSTPECTRDGLKLRLRVTRDTSEVIDLAPMGERSERDYFREAAAAVFGVLDPFVAIAAMAEIEPLRATILARQLVRAGHPDAKWAHNLIGDIAFSNGNIEAAMAEFRAALAIDPQFSVAQNNLGFALLAVGDTEAARAEFDQVEARDPRNVGSARGFAAIALSAGDFRQAVDRFIVASQRDPLEPEHLVQAGQYSFEAGDIEGAERYLREALAIDPGDLDALRILGDHYLKTGRRPSAEKLYRDWADYDPESAPARFALGNVRLASRDYAGALAYYDEAVSLGDATPETQAARAEALRGLGRDAEADAIIAAEPVEPG